MLDLCSPLSMLHARRFVHCDVSARSVSTLDSARLAQLVEWLRPLRTLAPVLGITFRLLETTARAVTRGSCEAEAWESLLEAWRERPEGLPELMHIYIVGTLRFRAGYECAAAGDPAYAAHAEQLAKHKRTAAQASSLRLLYALSQGSMQEAARQRKERAIATLSSGHEDQLLAMGHVPEFKLLDACGDLLELQRLASWFEARAQRFPNWSPFAAAARACCWLLCDQGAKAEPLLAAELAATPPLRHAAWYVVRSLRAEAALQVGDAALARDMAAEVLQIALAAGANMRPDTRAERVLALALAVLGDTNAALAVIEALLREVEAETTATVRAGQLYETRARIALLAKDRAAFATYCARVTSIYSRTAHPGLVAKLQRLLIAGRGQTSEGNNSWPGRTKERHDWHDTVHTELERLNRQERFDYLLALLLDDGQASAGHLYANTAAGQFTRVATRNTLASDAGLDAQVNAYALSLLSADEETTRTLARSDTLGTLTRQLPESKLESYTAVVLRSAQDKLQGIALLRTETSASSALSRGCAPELCLLVADVLEREGSAG